MLGTPYTLHEIAQYAAAKDLFQGYTHQDSLTHISFDTRTIIHGSQTVFIALSGAHRDGHDFIPQAIQKGVKNFIVDRPIPHKNINYALVANTLEALQLWAMYHRNLFDYPIIGITGSNGKTTVKEWLATLLEWEYHLVKSPLSYNSQIGVPLSLLQLHHQADLGIIEVGVSQSGDMEQLVPIVRPTLGVLTHMGDAHNEGFLSITHKLEEKCTLFEEVSTLVVGSQQKWVSNYLNTLAVDKTYVGRGDHDVIQLIDCKRYPQESKITVQIGDHTSVYQINVPFSDQASIENVLLAIGVAYRLGLDFELIRERTSTLKRIYMRTEIISDNPNITLINDVYNSDLASVYNSFNLLKDIQTHLKKYVIISDVPHQGAEALNQHHHIYQTAIDLFGQAHVFTIGDIFRQVSPIQNYLDTASLKRAIRYEDFLNSTVLLKGARKYELEQLIPLFHHKHNATYLRIDLNQLIENFKILKNYLPPFTRTMCVIKAASYGNGTWEIARELAEAGTDYLAVAYTSEGIDLRNARIELPIMVMNPDINSIASLVQYELEPEIANFAFLKRYVRYARLVGKPEIKLHIKLETGMGRLGFVASELDALSAQLVSDPNIQVISLMSHLAAADNPTVDEFTFHQIAQFEEMSKMLADKLGIQPLRHILNSKGVLRFPQYAFEMVRLGAGLYGINTTDTKAPIQEIGALYTVISQIRTYPPQTSIGYGRSQFTQRQSRIATVAIGYADGLPRNLSNGQYAFLIRGKLAPIFGRVCMDMTMVDVTDIPTAQSGDEVVIFGRQEDNYLSVDAMAKQAQTIPYEILVRIGSRVRRIYTKE